MVVFPHPGSPIKTLNLSSKGTPFLLQPSLTKSTKLLSSTKILSTINGGIQTRRSSISFFSLSCGVESALTISFISWSSKKSFLSIAVKGKKSPSSTGFSFGFEGSGDFGSSGSSIAAITS
jgi:hypothetical protein